MYNLKLVTRLCCLRYSISVSCVLSIASYSYVIRYFLGQCAIAHSLFDYESMFLAAVAGRLKDKGLMLTS